MVIHIGFFTFPDDYFKPGVKMHVVSTKSGENVSTRVSGVNLATGQRFDETKRGILDLETDLIEECKSPDPTEREREPGRYKQIPKHRQLLRRGPQRKERRW